MARLSPCDGRRDSDSAEPERRAAVRGRGRGKRLPHPIPLADGDPDVLLNLQAAFATVYERAAYAYSLDYRQPAVPPLGDTEAAVVRQILEAAVMPASSSD